MRYAFLIYAEERDPSLPPDEKEWQEVMAAYEAFEKEIASAGVKEGGEALEWSSTATCVTVKGGQRTVTDGPFAETKEQLGGFYILNCKDLDEALDFAAKIPGARWGSIEVRPIMEFE